MRFPCLVLWLLLGACGTGRSWSLVDPGQPDAAQRALLVECERRYRQGEPFDEQRAQVVADPVASWWFTRMVVRHVMSVKEGKITGSESQQARIRDLPQFLADGRQVQAAEDDEFLRAAVGHRDPVEVRARAELVRLGAAAVPCLIHDLALHPQSFVRQNGAELLACVGAPALPAVEQELGRSEQAVRRRTAVAVLAAMPRDAAGEACLRAFAADPDYSVRAAAFAAMAESGPDTGPFLCRVVAAEPDAFARRAAARAVASHRQAASGHALVAYLQRCMGEHDGAGVEVAQAGLQRLARSRGFRSVDAWRAWATGWQP